MKTLESKVFYVKKLHVEAVLYFRFSLDGVTNLTFFAN